MWGSVLAVCVLITVLKLCHVISWSWWWLLAPVSAPVIMVIIMIGLVILKDRVDALIEYLKDRRLAHQIRVSRAVHDAAAGRVD
jgi:hypothetical protein